MAPCCRRHRRTRPGTWPGSPGCVPTVAALRLAGPDSVPLVTTLPLASSADALERLRDRECTQRRLRSLVDAALLVGEPTTRERALVLPGVVRLVGTDARSGPVRVIQVGGSVLYTVLPDSSLPTTLRRQDVRLDVPVVIRSTRCTGHEVGEAKKPYDFGVWLAERTEATWFPVRTSTTTREELMAYLADACGLSAPTSPAT